MGGTARKGEGEMREMDAAASGRQMLDVRQAAEYLGIAAPTLYKLHFKIRRYRVGRKLLFDRKDLDAFLEGCAEEPLE